MAQPDPAPQAPIDPPVLQLVDGVPTTTSRYVAQYFGRHHRDVMRTIRTLIDTDESCLRNFAQVERAIQNHNGGTVDYPEGAGGGGTGRRCWARCRAARCPPPRARHRRRCIRAAGSPSR